MHASLRHTRFYRFWCWLWIAISVCGVAGGLYLLHIAREVSARQQESVVVGGVGLIVFALLRIANSACILRGLNRQRSRQ